MATKLDPWQAVDEYLGQRLLPADPVLEEALRSAAAAGLPEIAVSPAQGKFLHLLARICRARRVLELGTLGGYSTIWLARALPADGTLITLEAQPAFAEVARTNIARAGLADRVEIVVGAALDTLPNLKERAQDPFDFVFIDADKPNSLEYVRWALQLSGPGSVIVLDNVVRQGALADPTTSDENVVGMRRVFDFLPTEPRLSAAALQTVGVKGYDGFALLLVQD
ncbi:O-methyltransferase [Candidatus Dormiibacter inghamiae]|uniref:O-methyltransferase n=1 Tax=Candidatus Dormiibacter inghamiae TaxID=3127013 RepID=UPI0030C6FC0D